MSRLSPKSFSSFKNLIAPADNFLRFPERGWSRFFLIPLILYLNVKLTSSSFSEFGVNVTAKRHDSFISKVLFSAHSFGDLIAPISLYPGNPSLKLKVLLSNFIDLKEISPFAVF